MASFSIRHFEASDAIALHCLEEKYFSTPMPIEYISSITEKDNVCFNVCVNEYGELLGYCGMMWVLDEGSIISVAVRDEYRKLGIGSALMRSILDESKELGLESLTLEVRKGNLPAIELYKKLNFSVRGNMKDYYSFPKEDAIIMTHFFSEV